MASFSDEKVEMQEEQVRNAPNHVKGGGQRKTWRAHEDLKEE